MNQRCIGWCHWCGRGFREGFARHLAANRACMILARALTAEAEPELQQAANLLHGHADRICSDAFAERYQLADPEALIW